MIRIAILDDYQNASLKMADWSPLAGRAMITVFRHHRLWNRHRLVDSQEIRRVIDKIRKDKDGKWRIDHRVVEETVNNPALQSALIYAFRKES